MYGLAVNLIVSVSGHPWIIDEINKKVQVGLDIGSNMFYHVHNLFFNLTF